MPKNEKNRNANGVGKDEKREGKRKRFFILDGHALKKVSCTYETSRKGD